MGKIHFEQGVFCGKYLGVLRQNIKFVFVNETWVSQNRNQFCQYVLQTTSKGSSSVLKVNAEDDDVICFKQWY